MFLLGFNENQKQFFVSIFFPNFFSAQMIYLVTKTFKKLIFLMIP